MYKVGDTTYTEFYVRNVNLNLQTCKLKLEVIFTIDGTSVGRVKHFEFDTNCDCDIDDYIEKIKQQIDV